MTPPDPMEADALEAGLAAAFASSRDSIHDRLERVSGSTLPRVRLRGGAAVEPAPGVLTPRLRPSLLEVGEEFARGGMGVLLRARDPDLGRDVALKVLREDLSASPAIVRRFLEEAQVAGQLEHPGIVPVYELGLMAGDRPYFAMKLVQGRSLAAVLAEGRAGSLRPLLGILLAVCRTVAYAHSRGVIHRDLKPANVLVGDFGEVQVIDWGLALVLGSPMAGEEARSVLGTPGYMSPEQAGESIAEVDERSDVFALGVMLLEALAARALPRQTGELAGILEELARGGSDPELLDLCRRCLSRDPALRPRHAGEVAAGIEQHLDALELRGRQALVRAAEVRVRTRAVVLATGILATCAAALGLGLWSGNRALERGVGEALAEASLGLGTGDWGMARSALARARTRSESPLAGPGLRGRVEELAARVEEAAREAGRREALLAEGRRLVEGLLDVRQPEGDAVYRTSWEDLDRAYARVLEDQGLDLLRSGAEDLAAELRARGLGLEFASLLDEWLVVARAAGAHERAAALLALVRLLDPDPGRLELRAALGAIAGEAPDLLAIPLDVPSCPAPTLRLLARALRQAGRVEPAIDLLRSGVRRHPEDFLLNVELARALRTVRPMRAEEALGYYRAAVALRPGSREAWHELSMTLHPLLGRAGEAREVLEELVQRFPGDGHLLFHLGTAQLELGRVAEALETLRSSVDLAPGDALAWTNLGLALDRSGRAEESIEAYRAAIALGGCPVTAHHNLGVLLRTLSRHEEALEEFEHALACDGSSTRTHVELAYLLGRMGDAAGSVEHARRALELAPDEGTARIYLAGGLRDQGLLPEALLEYRAYLEQYPDSIPALRALVFLVLGDQALLREGGAELLRHSGRLAELNPDLRSLHGAHLFLLGRAGEALEHLDGEDGFTRLFAALARESSGDRESARARLEGLDLDALEQEWPEFGSLVDLARAIGPAGDGED